MKKQNKIDIKNLSDDELIEFFIDRLNEDKLPQLMYRLSKRVAIVQFYQKEHIKHMLIDGNFDQSKLAIQYKNNLVDGKDTLDEIMTDFIDYVSGIDSDDFLNDSLDYFFNPEIENETN